MAQYTFSSSNSELISDIEDIQARSPGLSFSRTIELLLLQATKERKRQRQKNAKKVHTASNSADVHQNYSQ